MPRSAATCSGIAPSPIRWAAPARVVWRLITGVPERLRLATLAALCDILDCGPGDLVEPVAGGRRAAGPAATTDSGPLPRPVRARVTGAARGQRPWPPAARQGMSWPGR